MSRQKSKNDFRTVEIPSPVEKETQIEAIDHSLQNKPVYEQGSCGKCRYWDRKLARCHAHPPTMVAPYTINFPMTQENDWCGEYAKLG